MWADLEAVVGQEHLVVPAPASMLQDATEERGFGGRADALVRPGTAQEVARVVRWCYDHAVPIVPRGGGTGFAGGAVPLDGGLVLSLARLDRVRSFDPLLWRIEVEAGVTTGRLRELARGQGLFFAPDPGAAEQSQIGGNVATNAGGPHAFKYGVTGRWVTGLEAVVPPGEIVRFGGPVAKDVAGYDLKRLLIGSEGTLAVITAAWLRLLPAPEASFPVAAFYGSAAAGCEAILRIVGSGIGAAAIEYLDAGTLRAAGKAFPVAAPGGAAFLVVAEADGSTAEAGRVRAELLEALGEDALALHAPEAAADAAALWRWRDGVSFAVTALRGRKVSEDVAVPLDRMLEGIEATVEIGARHGIEALSWGHAGDGNLHPTFLFEDDAGLEAAERAAEELMALVVRLGGTVAGEHGVGILKRPYLGLQQDVRVRDLQRALKAVFDPKGLLNPGKAIG